MYNLVLPLIHLTRHSPNFLLFPCSWKTKDRHPEKGGQTNQCLISTFLALTHDTHDNMEQHRGLLEISQ